MSSTLAPSELKIWLEWAGARLIAMSGGKVGPKNYKVAWPDYGQDVFEVLNFRGGVSLRAMAPSSTEISIMEEILLLPNLCEKDYVRRVLHLRALVHPLNGRYLFPWPRISKRLEVTKLSTVKYWHRKGLVEVISKAPKDKVRLISDYIDAAEVAYLGSRS